MCTSAGPARCDKDQRSLTWGQAKWHSPGATTAAHLECQKEADRLQALLPAVNVVAQEQIIGIWRKVSILEEP